MVGLEAGMGSGMAQFLGRVGRPTGPRGGSSEGPFKAQRPESCRQYCLESIGFTSLSIIWNINHSDHY